MLDYRLTEEEIWLNYHRRTERCSWSVFDAGGIEMCSGKLTGSSPHKISLGKLPPEVYELCIIDGDRVINAKFRVENK